MTEEPVAQNGEYDVILDMIRHMDSKKKEIHKNQKKNKESFRIERLFYIICRENCDVFQRRR